MAIVTSVVTVQTTATLLASAVGASIGDTLPITVRNDSGSTVYVGGSDVTTSNGMALPTDSERSLDLGPGDNLYGVAAAPVAIQVFKQRS